MRARIIQATSAATGWPSSGVGGEDLDHDEHIALILDESVGHNYELSRRSESNPSSKRLSQSQSNHHNSTSSTNSSSTNNSSDNNSNNSSSSSNFWNMYSKFSPSTSPSSSSSSSITKGHMAPHGGGISLGTSASASSLAAAAAASAAAAAASSSSASTYEDDELPYKHGHRPSFRVIGVQISHLSRTGQFLFCTLGVFFFLLIYGFLQEYMVIHVFERRLGLFLTLCQFVGYASLSALHRVIHADVPRRIPLGYYILLASLQATMQGLTNLSMRWLNYPAKMLFKSSRVIPTMIVGMLYMKKRYKVKDYVVVALLSLGLVFFIRADVKVSPSFHPLGIIFICMALAVDAAIVNLQEFTLRKYDASHDELIFYSYGLGSIFLLIYCLLSMELWDGLVFLHKEGAKSTACLLIFCSCGYFGVTCVAALTKKFGALASTMTTTARKALTLFLSFFIFPKPATAMHVVGGILFVMGLTVKAVPTPGSGGGGKRSRRDSGSAARAALKSSQIRSLLSSAAGPIKKGGSNQKSLVESV